MKLYRERFGINNFDLIRLFAAFQVLLLHTSYHLKVDIGYGNLLKYFPGVPIFFCSQRISYFSVI